VLAEEPSKMTDAFFSQKIRTLFHRFDLDKNGCIEVEDFEKWSNNLAQIGNLDAEKTATLTKNLMRIWEVYFLPADTNKDGSIEVQELITHMKLVTIINTKI
jgi:hypothetical protein